MFEYRHNPESVFSHQVWERIDDEWMLVYASVDEDSALHYRDMSTRLARV